MSYPEVLLWQRLRRHATCARFRRQHPVGPYIADFYCAARHLVIEVDGQVHDGRTHADAERNRFFRDNGYALVRLAAAHIVRDADGAAASIRALVARPLPHQPAAGGPPPRAGEDQE